MSRQAFHQTFGIAASIAVVPKKLINPRYQPESRRDSVVLPILDRALSHADSLGYRPPIQS